MFATLSTGQTLAYDRHGEERATPLVLLHGLSGDRRTYDRVISSLLDGRVGAGEFQVINVDMRGHGDSTKAAPDAYDATSYAADIAELIGAVVGRPAVVVGHSLGGVVAAQLAAQHPDAVRALLLEDPPFFESDPERRAMSPVASFFPMLVAAVRELQARDAAVEDYAELAVFTPPEEVAERCHSLRRWDPATMQAAVDSVVWQGFDPVAALDRPMTILAADPEMGAVFKPDDAPLVCAANPQARVVTVAGATHGIHSTPTLDAYLGHLDDFLGSLA